MRRAILIGLVVATMSAKLSAQLVVYDPAVTFRNSVIALLKTYLFINQYNQHDQLRLMARRLSAFADLNRYYLIDIPYWRIHNFWDDTISRPARDYHAALNYGDRSGAAFVGATHELLNADAALASLDAKGRRALLAQLATVNVADAVAIAGTDQAGLLRYNGRKDYDAIEALQAHVIDPSLEQSATAIADKISGAVVIGARERQARIQMTASILEQLLVDSKRDRDTAAAAMNMQIVTWRDSRAANEAFVAGSGDALRTWRQR